MRILATISFSFAASVFGANSLLPQRIWIPCAAGLAVLCLLVWFACGALPRKRRLAAVLVLAGLSAGLAWTAGFNAIFFEPARALDGRTVWLEGVVEDYPQQSDYGYSVYVRGKAEEGVSIPTLLYTDEQGASLRPGDRIRVITHCTLAERTLSGKEITYYTAKGIFLQGEAYGRLEVDRPEVPGPRFWPAYLAHWLSGRVEQSFPEDAAPLVEALITGNRENLSDPFTTSLQRTGLSHVVAVSGMHLSVLAGMVTTLLGKGRRRTAVITGIFVIVFCGVVGNTPSVVRAAVMILLLQAAPLFGRERDGATSLGFALMLLLMWNPYSAANLGLQLSFASVAGIQCFSDRIQKRLLAVLHLDGYERRRLVRVGKAVPRFVVTTLATTFGAMVLTVPLVAVYFGTFSIIAPLSNLLILWAVSLLLLGGVAVVVLGWMIPLAGALLAIPVTGLARYVNWVVDVLGSFPMASVPLDSFYYRAWLAFVYLMLGAGLMFRGRKRVIVPGCACIITFCLAFLMTAASFRTGAMTVTVLDVGQGQSVLLRMGNFYALMDCGGDGVDDPGDVAADYLQSVGQNRLDLLILSHYHADHANGVAQLLRRIQVSGLVLPDVEEGDELREEILALAEERDIPVFFLREDTTFQLEDDLSLTLYPPLGQGTDTNELGLSLLASAGTFDLLVTGDMSGEVEPLLLEHARLPDLELLVVGHHGSDTSTTDTLLQATRPETAIISVGENNRYGHPAQTTLDRLTAAGVDVYRTDRQGTVTLRAGG